MAEKYYNFPIEFISDLFSSKREVLDRIRNYSVSQNTREFRGSPKAGLNTKIFRDYRKNYKSEFELACLAAYLAIKSILGTKSYCKTTNLYLWSRMCGYHSKVKDVSELSESVARYANEYQTRRIKRTLVESWGLRTYAHYTRGFYVSFDMTLTDLIFQAEKRRKSN